MQLPSERETGTAAGGGDPATQRLLSLDVYRGIIMVALAFTGFGLAATARNHLKQDNPSPIWETVYFHSEHAEWTGGGFWDMIQPSFMFMVGAAMAFSYAKRRRLGHSYGRMLGHAVVRSVVLIILGILLAYRSDLRNWGLMNVLTQIGLGYTFLFLLWGKPVWVQAAAAALILVGTWLLYTATPGHGIDLERGAPEIGVKREWAQEHLTGIDPAWHKNANVGHDVDLFVLNALPRTKEFTFNGGGYQTINFVPSLATMIFGLMCGQLLRSGLSGGRKFLLLLLAGGVGVAAGMLLDETGVIPIVKRIWTPSWALCSTGWCCWILAALYGFIDLAGYRRWTFPLVVVGMNSIAIYAMGMLFRKPVTWPLREIFGENVFTNWAGLWGPTLECTLTGLVFWLACYAMYRAGVFLRV